MKNTVLIILALLLQMTAKTQVTFEKIITKGSIETGWSVIQTSDGGYAFLGSLGASLSSDRWLVKTDYLGDTLWTKTFPGIGYENGDRSLIQAADGGFTFIANRNGKADLLHVSSAGDSLWEKELFSGIGISIVPTSNQGYVVTGRNAIGPVIHIALAGQGGDLVWARAYKPVGDNSTGCKSWTVCELPTNDFIVAGEIESNYFYNTPFIMKIGAAGDSVWCRSYAWFMDATIFSADTAGNGDFFVGGIGHHANPNTVLMRMNASGDTVWTRAPMLAGNQFFNSIRSTGDGGVLGCGSYSNTADSNRAYLVKYSAAGSISWQRTFGNYLNSYGLSINSTADNGYIICGQVQQTTTSGQHALLIKTDANGNFAGIENHIAEKGCYFYPNPASDITTLSLVNISNGNPVIIRLYDLYGREVKTIQATLVLKGYTLDVADLPDGIYLAVIESDGQTIGRSKLVKRNDK